MRDLNFLLGQLETKTSELIKRMDRNDEAHEIILSKIENLNFWRFKVIGGSIVIFSLINVILNILIKNFF